MKKIFAFIRPSCQPPPSVNCNLAAVAAFAGLAAGLALRGNWWWPFAVILGILGFGYLLGLSSYGVAAEGPGDDQETGHRPPAPVGHSPPQRRERCR
ncbi:MAG: hypothetical protein J2P33_01475 [Actinobacteria bacterium]|nr:hypothetical protein [Actinomycetota bacterium]